jgi:hypothetical protein
MIVSIKTTAWQTTIKGEQHNFDMVDCFVLSSLLQYSQDLEGTAYVPAEEINSIAVSTFGDGINIEEKINDSAELLESLGLVHRVERGTVLVALKAEGMRVARRLVSYVEQISPVVLVCSRNNPILEQVDFTTAE